MADEGKAPNPQEKESEIKGTKSVKIVLPPSDPANAQISTDDKKAEYASVRHAENDSALIKGIVEALEKNGAQRVFLQGESGIGKTRLAKLVGEHVTSQSACFTTICLHLNQKFTDEWSLYENIAAQLSVYPDFEETEVDDRDEDEEEEKTQDVLLAELKKKIVEEIEKREKAMETKQKADEAKKKEIEERMKKADEERKKRSEEEERKGNLSNWGIVFGEKKPKDVPDKAAENLPAAAAAGGDKKDVLPPPMPSTPYLLLILDDEGDKGYRTSETYVMKTLKLDEFLRKRILLADKPTSLKVLVTRRREREANSESETKEEDKDNEEEITESEATEKEQVPEQVNKGVPPTGDESKEHDTVFDDTDLSDALCDSITDDTQRDLFLSLLSEDWKTDESFIDKMVKNSKKSPAALTVLAKSLNQISRRAFSESKEKMVPVLLSKAATLGASAASLPNEQDLHDMRHVFSSRAPEEWKNDENFIAAFLKESKTSLAAMTELVSSLEQIHEGTFTELKEKIAKEIVKVIPDLKPKPTEQKVIATTDQPQSIDQPQSTDQPESTDEPEETDQPESTEAGSSSESTITTNPIFHLAYVLLEKFGPPESKSTILDCFWHSLDFFEHCGCVYYRDLITQWILEGYFDPVRSVDKAYQAGHSILMELINRGMLKIQENNVVVPEMAMSIFIDPRRRGHLGSSRLGFSRVYTGDKKKGIGKITQIDDMIKTVQAKKRDEITTILVGGDRLRRETPERYFKKLGHLEVLGLFEPTLDPFLSALLKINQNELNKSLLRVLVIRDCDLLNNIKELRDLPALNALEVSGASSLKEIPDDFFKAFPKLESLHLSGLQITTSPSSISKLLELHCLIIRDCPLLEDLPDIQKLVKLEVVDVSGARGLQTCFDNKKGEQKDKSKNKNFYMLKQLQVLDFSESQIERLPIFQDSAAPEKLHKVTRLLLRNCSKLRRLPSLKPLSGLQILDLSGTSNLVEMLEVCFEDKKELKTLNLSGTNLAELADTINELHGLSELLLKNATKLETIPKIDDLEKLEVIDVSGSTKLKTIDGSFEKMHYLREVDLSGTDIKDIPKLPTESKMCCEKLITLPDGRKFKGAKWEDIEAKIEMSKTPEEASTSEISEEASISKAVVESQGIIEKKSEGVVGIQANEPLASDGSEKGDVSKERLLQVPKEKTLYTKTLSLVDPAFRPDPEGMEINGTNAIDWNALEKAEFVYFVDITSTMLPLIFEKAKSMKGCWLRFCIDIKDLFAGVAADHLESLVNLYITNLPSLEIISSGCNLKNLKNITIEYCPIIKTLFPEAPPKPVPVPEPAKKSSSVPEPAQKPTVPEVVEIKHLDSLETLSITNLQSLETISRGASLNNLKNLTIENCEKLEKIVEGGEAPTLTHLEVENCPNFPENDWVMVTPPEEA